MNSGRVQGLFWIIVGAAIFYGAWTMDRLANLGVQAYSAPGLLPGVLGLFIALLGLAMLARGAKAAGEERIEWRRIWLPLALCLAFAGGLVGRGLPFWLAAWIFVAVMIFTLEYRSRTQTVRRLLLTAVAVGAAAGLVISLVFQELFLIRLP